MSAFFPVDSILCLPLREPQGAQPALIRVLGCFPSVALGLPVASLSVHVRANLTSVLLPRRSVTHPPQRVTGRPRQARPCPGLHCDLCSAGADPVHHHHPGRVYTDFSPPGTAVACLSCQVLSGNLALVTQTGRGLGVGWGVLRVLESHGGVVGAMPAELELPCLLSEGLGAGEDTAVADVACAAAAGLWLGGASDTTRRLPLPSVGTGLASGMEGVPEGPCLLAPPHRGHRKDLGPAGVCRERPPGTDPALAFLASQVPGTGWPSGR